MKELFIAITRVIWLFLIAQAVRQTWDILVFVYFLSQKKLMWPHGYCAPPPRVIWLKNPIPALVVAHLTAVVRVMSLYPHSWQIKKSVEIS